MSRQPESQGRPPVSPFLFLLALTLIQACGQSTREGPSSPGGHVLDDLGILVPNTPAPHRIISLAPSITETLFALGLDSSIIGVTEYCNHPAAARLKESIGGMTNPSFERIAGLNPDLILMSVAGNSRADYDKLVNLGFRVFVSNPSGIDEVYESIQKIGQMTGAQTAADSLVDSMRAEQERLTKEARQRPARDILMLLSLRPPIAAGDKTFLQEMLLLANTRNLAVEAPTSYPLLSREHVLSLQPDVIFVLNDAANSPEKVYDAFPEWRNFDTVRSRRVTIIDADVVSRPGPRIMLGLRQIVAALH